MLLATDADGACVLVVACHARHGASHHIPQKKTTSNKVYNKKQGLPSYIPPSKECSMNVRDHSAVSVVSVVTHSILLNYP